MTPTQQRRQTPKPQSETQGFADLPLELLQRIITVGPCESALALSQVNKSFNSICRRSFIYTEIIKDKLKHDSLLQGKIKTPWYETALLAQQDDHRIIARWALADSRARATGADNNIALSNKPLPLLEWEPHLLVANHPETRAICVRARADSSAWSVTDTEQALRVSFMFAYSMMFLDVDCPGRSSNLSRTETEVEKLLQSCWKRLQPIDSLPPVATTVLKQPLALHRNGWETRIIAELALGWYSQHLAHAQRIRQIHRVGNKWAEQLPLPCLSNVPLAHLMRVGSPFSSQPTFSHEAIPTDAAALQSFLEDGEWVGYYCYSFHRGGVPVFDSMMLGIRFEVSDSQDGDPDRLSMKSRGRGEDGCGTFALNGEISISNGHIAMSKLYSNTQSWNWSLVITAFGFIGGTWGSDRWGGWLFLWKREWVSSTTDGTRRS